MLLGLFGLGNVKRVKKKNWNIKSRNCRNKVGSMTNNYVHLYLMKNVFRHEFKNTLEIEKRNKTTTFKRNHLEYS